MKKILSFSLLFFINQLNAQIITTVAGNGTNGFSGDGGQATDAEMYAPDGIAFDAGGNLYIAEFSGERIRKVTTAGIITTVVGNGTVGYSGDGGQATAAALGNPRAIVFDAVGNLYIADGSKRIRVVTTAGIITTCAGNGTAGYTGDGGQATAAEIYAPAGIACDADGNLYIADYSNHIRKVTTAGIITTVVGNGTAGYSGDGGQATAAEINKPNGLTFDAAGNLYIADYSNSCVRKITTSGIITTVAGNDTAGYSGDGGQATNGKIHAPNGVACDAAGNLYISDYGNSRIRKVTTSGIITTVVGNGTVGSSGDGGQATAAELVYPQGVTFDAVGNLYIVDLGDPRIRMVCNSGCSTADINQITNNKKQVNIYPNPAGDVVNLQSGNELGLVTIYNSLGEIVYTKKTNANELQIDLSKQAPGIYFLQTQNNYLKIIKE